MTTKQEVVCTGVVLKSTPYKENGALLQVFTHEYGKITIHARGIKKINSKNMAGCQTLTLSEFTILLKKGISTLIKATPISFYSHIKSDIELEAYASFVCEFVYKECPENYPDDNIYHTIIETCAALENGYPPAVVYLIYLVFILKVTGSMLHVDACCQCMTTSNITAISVAGGGFICNQCTSRFDSSYDKEFLQLFRHINKCTIKHVDKINVPLAYRKPMVEIMEQFVDEYTGIHFQATKILKQIRIL